MNQLCNITTNNYMSMLSVKNYTAYSLIIYNNLQSKLHANNI